MITFYMMLRRMRAALKYAIKEEQFGHIAGAGATLVLVGTVAYTFGEGWSPVDSFYFAVATLTTSSIADPDLVITSPWLKLFTSLYVVTGIGILVEVARRLGMGFIASRQDASRQSGDEDE